MSPSHPPNLTTAQAPDTMRDPCHPTPAIIDYPPRFLGYLPSYEQCWTQHAALHHPTTPNRGGSRLRVHMRCFLIGITRDFSRSRTLMAGRCVTGSAAHLRQWLQWRV